MNELRYIVTYFGTQRQVPRDFSPRNDSPRLRDVSQCLQRSPRPQSQPIDLGEWGERGWQDGDGQDPHGSRCSGVGQSERHHNCQGNVCL